MTHTYKIEGMTCGGCVAKVKSELLKLAPVTDADVRLQYPQARITMQQHVPVHQLQRVLTTAGSFTISELNHVHQPVKQEAAKARFLTTYKPVLLIGAYILGITLLVEVFNQQPDGF